MKALPNITPDKQGTPARNMDIASVPGMAREALRQPGGQHPIIHYAPTPRFDPLKSKLATFKGSSKLPPP